MFLHFQALKDHDMRRCTFFCYWWQMRVAFYSFYWWSVFIQSFFVISALNVSWNVLFPLKRFFIMFMTIDAGMYLFDGRYGHVRILLIADLGRHVYLIFALNVILLSIAFLATNAVVCYDFSVLFDSSDVIVYYTRRCFRAIPQILFCQYNAWGEQHIQHFL